MSQEHIEPGPAAVPELVDRLDDLASDCDEVPLGRLIEEIGAQGHAPLLMIVAALMILPLGMIPGIGGALGLIAAAIGLQMLLGRHGVWTPGFIRRRSLPAGKLRGAVDRMRPPARWLRRRLHIRLEALSSGRVSLSLIALVLIAAGGSLVVLGAIPIATPLMGLPIAIFALGILSRDGVVVAVGWGVLCLSVLGVALGSQTLSG
ncbi:exopolysaccharide biosynthesis protein [Mangrovicoccus algicola]|uniref:Exopolysaccharide biosynthesis protein n=1 Tax=Mangrovicoccus algicola TaxID=2771008 RepID=A0A8J7D0P9_9RHOB|nr:exopolysaccharide biosynthesis protein [Mangrovicoccus algicola]MBE3639763.1 exopolysaccharide biosynthesis protein [Mangrovicoccus algicola]